MSDSKSTAGGGIGFGGLLAIVFITLKLCHVIDWQWKWVLAPIWIPVCIVLVIFAICAIGFLIAAWLKH